MKVVARPKRAKPDQYGETKQRYMFMLTETASNALEAASEETGLTRSELLERLVRQFLDKLLIEEKKLLLTNAIAPPSLEVPID